MANLPTSPSLVCERCGNTWVRTFSPAVAPIGSRIDEVRYCPECIKRIYAEKNEKSRAGGDRTKTVAALKEFAYRARDKKGKSVSGFLKAKDMPAATEELIKRGLVVIALEERQHLTKVQALAILVAFSLLILWAFLKLAK